MEKDLQELLERAERTFGGRPIEATVPRARAIVGPERFAVDLAGNADLVAAADTALEMLRGKRSGTPTVAQFKALQIMIRLARPSIYSRDGALEPYPRTPGADDPSAERQQAWEVFRDKAQPLLYSVGRIDLGDRPFGTGFVIAPGLVLTNRHVLEALSFDTYRLEPGQATIDFGAEDGTVGRELPVPVEGVVGWHQELDLALLRTPVEDHRMPFVFGDDPAGDGDWVVALGYPMRDPSNSPEMMDQLFEGRYEIKRAAPGEVVGTRFDRVYHDCSTLGGNSGSPLVSLGSAEVVGVHSNGFFTWRNEGVAGAAARAFVASHTGGQQQVAGGPVP